MKGFLKWFGDAFAHAMGAIDARKRVNPPPIGMTPYRDIPDEKGTTTDSLSFATATNGIG